MTNPGGSIVSPFSEYPPILVLRQGSSKEQEIFRFALDVVSRKPSSHDALRLKWLALS
jgi:hypothetical protein